MSDTEFPDLDRSAEDRKMAGEAADDRREIKRLREELDDAQADLRAIRALAKNALKR